MRNYYLDILERAANGPRIKKDAWDLEQVVMTVRKLVKQYDLTWNKEQIICNDSALIDRVFAAGL